MTADLPEHFAASMDNLGFDEADGVQLPLTRAAPSKEVKKAEAKAHAKQYRKERRGERRSRSTAASPVRPVGSRSSASAPERPAKSRGPTKGKGSPKPVKR